MSFSLSVKLGLFETQFSVRFGSLYNKGGTHFVRKAIAWGWQGGGRTPQGDLWEDELHYSSCIICEAMSRQCQSKHWEKVTITCQIFLTSNQALWTSPGIFFFMWLHVKKNQNCIADLVTVHLLFTTEIVWGQDKCCQPVCMAKCGSVHMYVCIFFFCQSEFSLTFFSVLKKIILLRNSTRNLSLLKIKRQVETDFQNNLLFLYCFHFMFLRGCNCVFEHNSTLR